MTVPLMMDVHVRSAITKGLRLRGVDVITAQEDGSRRLSDSDLLDRATTLRRVLFSQDGDLLVEASARQESGQLFSGLVFAHQRHVTVGQCIHDLEFIAKLAEPDEMANTVHYLPLK